MTSATAMLAPAGDVKTFRGESLEELLPKIREQLGAEAVILRQRDGLTGGLAGFFQRRCVEVEARAGAARVDTYADGSEADARAAVAGEPPVDVDRDPAVEERLPPAESARPAAAPRSPGQASLPAEAAVAGGLEAPAIRALLAAAAPFADQLHAADVALAEDVQLPAGGATTAEVVPAEVLPAEVLPAEVLAAEPAATAETRMERPAAAAAHEHGLVAAGLSPELAADVVRETVSHLLPFGSPRGLKRLVRLALARRIRVHGPRAHGAAVIAFVGAGGSGKTLAAARLAAAYAARSDLDAVVVALRPGDGGARLRALLETADVPVEVVETAADGGDRVAGAGSNALVVVDAPAVSPGDAAAVEALASELRRMEVSEVHVCTPATMSAAAAAALLAAYAPLRPAAIAMTHVDETPQVGAVVELAVAGGPPLSFVGRGSDPASGLELADPAALAALVVS
jgi:flagellar biosynthesis protein FlhF